MPEVTEYRLNDHDRRLGVVEVECGKVAVVDERVKTLRSHVDEGFQRVANEFEAQGNEIKGLRNAVVGAAISISGSALIFALTIFLVFK